MNQVYPVILCGGGGSRLWPLSRAKHPKQFLRLTDPEMSLFQKTFHRVNFHANEKGESNCVVVCNEEHRFLVAEELRSSAIHNASIVLEPEPKNTAPAVALAALSVQEKDPILLVMPSDHLIEDTDAFQKVVRSAAIHAEQNAIVTFGITPTFPETGFGYIKSGNSLNNDGFVVDQFVEKPDIQTAREYVQSGDYLWNSGIFIFKASVYLKALQNHAPDMYKKCVKSWENRSHDMDFTRVDVDHFSSINENSIDYAVIEHVENAVVIPFDAAWNDVGAWSALWDVGGKDDNNNVCIGDVQLNDVTNSYIRSDERLLAVLGLDNIVVAETSDAVLVANKDCVQDVKKIVDRLKENNRIECTSHAKVARPWGTYQQVLKSDHFQVKKIVVNSGEKLSLQLHHHRAEHWVVVKGTAIVTRGNETLILSENQSTYIPLGMKHRLENQGVIPLELIEIQTGSYLGEDDIVRFEDCYGR